MDVLFQRIGEILGGSQRKERLDALVEKCKDFNLSFPATGRLVEDWRFYYILFTKLKLFVFTK